jgi:hypothetical protein
MRYRIACFPVSWRHILYRSALFDWEFEPVVVESGVVEPLKEQRIEGKSGLQNQLEPGN